MRIISRDELIKLEDRDDDYLLINVLGADSFREKHIPGSINVPISDEQFASRVERHVRDLGQTVIVYCGSPQCTASQQAAEQLEQAGFSNVLRYKGGLSDWEQAGLRLDSEKVAAR